MLLDLEIPDRGVQPRVTLFKGIVTVEKSWK